MKRLINFKFIILFLSLNSCSTDSFLNPFGNKFFYKSGYESVQLIEQDVKNIKNFHPVNIPQEKVKGALRLILIKKKSTSHQLFDERDLSNFSIAISDALKEARPNQDVSMTVEGWYKAKYIKNNHVSSARIFYNRKGLNIIFGSIMRKGIKHETDALVAATVNPDLKTNPYVPGSRIKTIKNPYVLTAPINSGVYRPKEAKNRVDWLVFTSKALVSRGPVTDQERRLAYRGNIEVQNVRDELNKLKAELRNFKNNRDVNYYDQYNYYKLREQQRQPQYIYPRNDQLYQRPYFPKQSSQRVTNSEAKNAEKINEIRNLRKRGLISEKEFNQRINNLIKD